MQNIALVSEHASPLCALGGDDSGGQNVYVANVARELGEQGYRVDVFTRRDGLELPPVVQWQPNVRVIHVPAGPAMEIPKEDLLPHMPAFAQYFEEFARARARPYDVIHANFFMSGWAGLQVSRALRIPLVVTFHALGRVRRLHQREADRFSDQRFDIEDELVQEADRIVAECPQDRLDLIEHYDADPSRIDIVPCGFDLDELHPVEMRRAREALGWPQDRFTVLQLGRMVPRKGVDNVIEAMAVLRERYDVPARLVVAGGNSEVPDFERTPELARLEEIARKQGVRDIVHFFGRAERSRLSLLYGASDVFVTTPWYEPFGITPVEAMACGRPVVGARVGGIAHTVSEGRTGFLVPPRDPQALAGRLACLYHDPALRQRMGIAARQRARRYYTWEKVGSRLLEVYRKAEGLPETASVRRLAETWAVAQPAE
jgi:D-inositol-3-phosphate glycosyltransferase